MIRLYHLRKLLNLTRGQPPKGISVAPAKEAYAQADLAKNIALLGVILNQARDEVASWGGQLYVVYLPDQRRYDHSINIDYLYRAQVMPVIKSTHVPIIDMYEQFNQQTDPLALYPFRRFGHYTEEGYQLVAQEILNSIKNTFNQENNK